MEEIANFMVKRSKQPVTRVLPGLHTPKSLIKKEESVLNLRKIDSYAGI